MCVCVCVCVWVVILIVREVLTPSLPAAIIAAPPESLTWQPNHPTVAQK